MKRVAFHTLGCKLNFAESSTIGRQFIEQGFHIAPFDEPADVYVLNTCSVTERADREARQIVRRALRKSPDAYVIVMGCYAQLQPEEIASIEGVDLVLGAREKFKLFEYVDGFTKKRYPQVHVSDIHEAVEFGPSFSAEVGDRTRAFLKIQDGCDYTCSFCTIPLARGESRSHAVNGVLNDARMLARRGYRELVLTGVNVGDFGRKSPSRPSRDETSSCPDKVGTKSGGTSLFELLRPLEQVEGIERIRISSIEPNLLTVELVDYIISSEKICNHFHIPLQSGSDTILKRMRRRYTSSDYQALIEYIRKNAPDAGIGADVIVGFPGETEELFNETYFFLVDLPVSYLHVFTYSERPHTPASQFDGAVEPRVRFERNKMLRILSQKKRHAFHSRFLGQTLPVLFEGRMEGSTIAGLTTNYIRVNVPEDGSLVNQIAPVTLLEIQGEECYGVVASTPSSQAFVPVSMEIAQ